MASPNTLMGAICWSLLASSLLSMAQAFAPAVPSINASAVASGFIFIPKLIFLWDFIAFLACLRTAEIRKRWAERYGGSALFKRRRRRQCRGGALPARTR